MIAPSLALDSRGAFEGLPTYEHDVLIEFLKSLPAQPPGTKALVVDECFPNASVRLSFCAFRDRSGGGSSKSSNDPAAPQVSSRRQTRPADLIGVESLAECLDVAIEVRLVEDLIESRVKRVRRAPWQVLRGHPLGRQAVFEPQRQPAAGLVPFLPVVAEACIGQGRLDRRRRRRGPNHPPAVSLQQRRDDAR